MNRNRATLLSLLLLASCSVVDPRRASLDFNALDHGLGEAQAMGLNSRLEWRCGDDDRYRHMFGQRVCDGLLDSLNSAPASRIDYLFRDGHMSAAIVQYPPDAYKAMKAQVEAAHGQGNDSASSVPRSPLSGVFAPGTKVFTWRTKGGVMMMSSDAKNSEGDLLLAWISNQELARFAGK